MFLLGGVVWFLDVGVKFMFLYFFCDNLGVVICCVGWLVLRFVLFVWCGFFVCDCFVGCGRDVGGFFDLVFGLIELYVVIGVVFFVSFFILGGKEGGGVDVFWI